MAYYKATVFFALFLCISVCAGEGFNTNPIRDALQLHTTYFIAFFSILLSIIILGLVCYKHTIHAFIVSNHFVIFR